MIAKRCAIALFAIAAITTFCTLGAAVWLGAHPFWAVQVGVIGAPIGALTVFMPIETRSHISLAVLLLVLAALAASLGKVQFAASYGENSFAGQLWYVGWIGLAIGAAVLLAAIGKWLWLRVDT